MAGRGWIGGRGVWRASWAAVLAFAVHSAAGAVAVAAADAPAAPKAAPAPYAVPPPTPPPMTRSPEEFPVTAINRMLSPLPPGMPRAPRAPRNLEGAWIHGESYTPRIRRTATGAPVPFTAAAVALMTPRIEKDNAGTPISNASTLCRPPGHLKEMSLNFPFSILQTPKVIYVLFEEYHEVWPIRMTPPPAKAEPPTYDGASYGRWDGDTLVVETSGFRQPIWLDAAGTPLSVNGRLTFRIRKIEDGQALEVQTTIDDPAMYTAPWSVMRKMVWRPDKLILREYDCESQVGASDGEKRYGLTGGEQ